MVERWIRRELAPAARLQRLAERGLRLLERAAERIEAEDAVPAATPNAPPWTAIGFAIGLAASALVMALARH